MPSEPVIFTRRRLFLLAAAGAPLMAADDDPWNSKPAAQWNAGDKYRVMNHSPWANPVEWWRPSAATATWDHLHSQLGRKGVITWESAQPVRDALKTALPAVLANLYVIGVDGAPSGAHSAGYLRRFAVLRSSGKPGWSVKARVAREVIRTSPVFLFGFSREGAPVGPDTGEVVFEMNLGQWMVQAKFKPKEMMYRGVLAV